MTNRMRMMVILPVIVILGVAFSPAARAFSLDGLFPELSEGPVKKVSAADLEKLVVNLNDNQSRSLLKDKETFTQFVEQENQRRSLIKAALSSGLERDPTRSLLLERQIEQLLINQYLQLHQNFRIAPGYPADEQVRAHYEQNKDKYVLEARVLVWQIFFPNSDEMSSRQLKKLGEQAEDISRQLRRGRLDFHEAAEKYSGHETSRLNGGFMGLLKVSNLKPEIREAINDLDLREVSDPIKTSDGFHIIRIDSMVPPQTVSFEQVEKSIRQLLRNEKVAQVRKEILAQTLKDYPPAEYSDKELDRLYRQVKKAAE